MRAASVLAGGFFAIISAGGLLLALPCAAADGRGVGLFDAMFTAASAVCVTGLSVVDVGVAYSRFGQTVLLCLIQVGGLGFMAMASLLFFLTGRRVSLTGRLLMRESMNDASLGGVPRLMQSVLTIAFTAEVCGAALLALRFVPEYGWNDGLFGAVFHSVSAFCNAGFDLVGGMAKYRSDPLVNFTVMGLITMGSLGFGVVADMLGQRRFSRFSLHTKLTLVMTAALLLSGCAVTLLLEWNNPLTLAQEGMRAGDKVMAAMFQSVTLRTAGFATIDQTSLTPAAKMAMLPFMFTGAASASTGGGVKLTTVAVILLATRAATFGREETVAFHRTISRDVITRAVAVTVIGLAAVSVAALALVACETTLAPMDLVTEAVSAFATVGLSAAGTPNLSSGGRALVMLLMYIGRVGPLTLALAIASKQAETTTKLRYPGEKVLIG